MVAIDERWEHLKAVRAAGYLAPSHHPDLNPANEALILREHFREALRLPDAGKHGAKFVELLKSADIQAGEAETLLRAFANTPTEHLRAKLDGSMAATGEACTSCHGTYRDRPGSRISGGATLPKP